MQRDTREILKMEEKGGITVFMHPQRYPCTLFSSAEVPSTVADRSPHIVFKDEDRSNPKLN